MEQIFETGYDVNVSHIIHDLSFGPSYPGVHNPLDGSERILHDISGTFKYFLKVGSSGYIGGSSWLLASTLVLISYSNCRWAPTLLHRGLRENA